jgi:hypothetical protein
LFALCRAFFPACKQRCRGHEAARAAKLCASIKGDLKWVSGVGLFGARGARSYGLSLRWRCQRDGKSLLAARKNTRWHCARRLTAARPAKGERKSLGSEQVSPANSGEQRAEAKARAGARGHEFQKLLKVDTQKKRRE